MGLSTTGRRRTALCVAILAALPFALFWRVALGQRVFGDGDLVKYNFPLLRAVAEQWKSGQFPLWNPYVFGGAPLHGNMQGGAFYPPNILLLLGPQWLAYQYSILLHYSLAAIFTFLYLRSLTLTRTAALLGAIVFAFSGFAVGHLGHVSFLRTIPWLPLILFAFERWQRTLDRRYPALAAAAIGVMLLAGHPQIPLYALMLSGAYAGWLVLSASRPKRVHLAMGLALAVCVGAGLAAIQWLPTLQLATQEYLRPADRSYDYFVMFSLCPLYLVHLVFPRWIPSDEAELAVFAGIPAVVLALLGAWPWLTRWREHGRFFSVIAVVGLLLAFGKWTPLAPLLFRVPLYNLFTSPARNLFEVHFALAVLAAIGAQVLLDSATPAWLRKRVAVVFLLLLLVAIAAVTLARQVGPMLDDRLAILHDVTLAHPAVLGRLPILFATLGLLYFFPSSRRWRRAAGAGLLFLATLDLLSYSRSIYGESPPAVYAASPAVMGFLNQQHEPGRILTLEQPEADPDAAKALLAPDRNASYGIESINGFDSLMLRQVDAVSDHVMPTYGLIIGAAAYNNPQFQRFMDLLNTRHVLTPAARTLELAEPRYRPAYEDALVRVFENTKALPRVFVVPQVRSTTREQALEVLASGQWDGVAFDPRQVALVEGAIQTSAVHWPTGPPGRVDALEEHAGRVRLTVDSPERALLVYSTNYSEGWRAFVDEMPVKAYRADGLLLGVSIPAGRHEVRLVYLPGAFVLGAAITLASALLAATTFLLAGRRRRMTVGSSIQRPATEPTSRMMR
jgi:hypothetical protein